MKKVNGELMEGIVENSTQLSLDEIYIIFLAALAMRVGGELTFAVEEIEQIIQTLDQFQLTGDAHSPWTIRVKLMEAN